MLQSSLIDKAHSAIGVSLISHTPLRIRASYLAEYKQVSEALHLLQCPAQLTTYETQPSFLVAAGALSFTGSRID